MSSNESVERMLKQLENLLRQQDRDQKEDTAEKPEVPVESAETMASTAEQAVEALPETPVVEVEDVTVPHEAPVAPHEVEAEPVETEVGVPEAEGLQVETLPSSEEDRHEIGDADPSQATGGAESGPAQVEAPAVDDRGAEADLGDAPVDEVIEVESESAPDEPIGFVPTSVEAVEQKPAGIAWVDADVGGEVVEKAPPAEAAITEAPATDPEPLDPEAPAAEVVREAEAEEADESTHHRRRFGFGDLLSLGGQGKEEPEPEEVAARESVGDSDDSGPVPVDQPAEVPEPDLGSESPDVPRVDPAPTVAESVDPQTAATVDDVELEQQQADADHPEEVADVQAVSLEDEVAPAVDDATDSGPAPESSDEEEEESPTSKYPAWWFRGGSVHRIEEDDAEEVEVDEEGRPVEPAGGVAKAERKLDVEPFVQREPVGEPPPPRKLISEQLDAEQAGETVATADDQQAAEIDAPPEVVIGVEGLDAVTAAVVDLQASDEAESPDIESESEPEDIDPAAETPAALDEEVEVPEPEVAAEPVEEHQVDESQSAVDSDDEQPVDEPTEDVPAAQVEPTRAGDTSPKRARRRLTARLGTLLLDAHLIAEKDLDKALKEHQVTGERLGYYLVDKGMVDEADLAQVLADQYGVPAADLEDVDIPSGVLGLVSEKTARRYMVLPLAVSEGAIDVAMVDPADVNAIQDIEFATGLRAQPLIATEWAVERAIQRLYAPEAMRTALSGRSARKSRLKDPRAIIKRIIRDRDEAVMQAEDDPHSAYDLAASLDEFVDEILRVARKIQD